ncbi:MAG: hypothetical protein ACU84Q_18175 [Gammaproteobacteria bacterium]
MANEQGPSIDDLAADLDNLYREETFTDGKAASVKRLTPVTPDGEIDPSRPSQFIGDTTLMTQMGPIPVQFQLEVDDLSGAFEAFPEGVRSAIERLNERAQEMAREEASRIVTPGGGGMPGGGLPGGGIPGGGKLIV